MAFNFRATYIIAGIIKTVIRRWAWSSIDPWGSIGLMHRWDRWGLTCPRTFRTSEGSPATRAPSWTSSPGIVQTFTCRPAKVASILQNLSWCDPTATTLRLDLSCVHTSSCRLQWLLQRVRLLQIIGNFSTFPAMVCTSRSRFVASLNRAFRCIWWSIKWVYFCKCSPSRYNGPNPQ